MGARDINIMGDGSVSGGEYGKVRIFGDADFTDGVEAQSITIFGRARVQAVTSGEINVAGSDRFNGNVQAGKIKVNGKADFYQRVKTDEIVVNGSLTAKQGVESEKFVSRGAFTLNHLNANDVEIYLAGRSQVQEIGGENVRVYTEAPFMFWHNLFGRPFQRLDAGIIEADRIYLEQTVAETVRGNNICIGPGCKIKLVEYKDAVSIDKDALVDKSVQI